MTLKIQLPQPIEEPSLQDAVPNERSDIVEDDCEVEYTVAESGSQKGRLKLADMLFSFKNKYHYTYLNTYIALYFSYAKVTCNTHTHNPKKLVSIPLTLVP